MSLGEALLHSGSTRVLNILNSVRGGAGGPWSPPLPAEKQGLFAQGVVVVDGGRVDLLPGFVKIHHSKQCLKSRPGQSTGRSGACRWQID